MPAERLPMRKIREILRLRWGCGLSARQIARSLKIARSSVAEYLRRARAAGLSWPLPGGLDETAIEQLLFPPLSLIPASQRPLPDWVQVHEELRRKGVTLFLLWQEYKARWPEGFQYSRFCALYRLWAKKLDLLMRQKHRAGEKMFVDYCGHSASFPASGELFLRAWIGQRCGPCPPSAMSMPNGRRPGSQSIITWKSRAITTVCLISFMARSWMCA